MPIGQTLKDFYQRKKDVIIIAGIVIALLFYFSGKNGPIISKQSNFGGSSSKTTGLSLSSSSAGFPMSEGFSDSIDKSRYASSPTYNNNAGEVPNVDKKIQKTAYLNLEVEKSDYNSAKKKINAALNNYNGFYVSQNEAKETYNNADYRTYFISIKFPKDKFDQAVNELKAVGELKNLSIDASDLTSQYYDTKGYLDSNIAVKNRIQKLLDQTTNITDIINIEQKLADLQRQIDSYQSQLTNIDRQTDYSQISVTLKEKRGYVESVYEMTKLRDLFRNSVRSFDNVFVLVSNLIGYAILFLIVWGAYKLIKKFRSK